MGREGEVNRSGRKVIKVRIVLVPSDCYYWENLTNPQHDAESLYTLLYLNNLRDFWLLLLGK
jgi:hypothetical protein